MAISSYPVRVDASLDPQVSRWLWLVKWILAVPHYLVLAVLWVAFVATSVAAFVSIAVNGRYPRSLFEFNVGVLRWSWRVHYYSFGAFGTDRYPPFTLAEVPDYPAHLDVSYPDHLSRGLVWVKWWLLAVPHYLIVGIFLGGGGLAAWRFGSTDLNWAPGGLVGVLVLIAAVILLITGRYPQAIFDLILGLNRWVLRVAAYAALMTDDYPPFRLDLGGHEPAHVLTLPPPPPPLPEGRGGWGPPSQPSAQRRGWTGGRIFALVTGAILALISIGLLAGGGVATWADNTQRNSAGYLATSTHSFSTDSYALTSGRIDLGTSRDLFPPADFLGTVRLQVTPTTTRTPIFVGIAPQAAVDRYLAGASRDEVTDWTRSATFHRSASGSAPTRLPTSAGIWTVESSGTGPQTLTWKPANGAWTVVVMNSDAHPGLVVNATIGATLPDLGWIGAGLLGGGALLLLAAGALILIPISRANR